MADKHLFPLCTAAGLNVQKYAPGYFTDQVLDAVVRMTEPTPVIFAQSVERMLESAEQVYGYQTENPVLRRYYQGIAWPMGIDPISTARVLLIQPLKADRAAALEREMFNMRPHDLSPAIWHEVVLKVVEKARALLEGEK